MLTLSKPNPSVDASGKQLDKYPLYGIVAAFPGTGKEHPLQPGESVVIANDATDWSADGAANLTNADWECYVPDAGQADADYDAPNLEIVYNLENQRRLGAGFFGGGLVMAKLPEGMTPSQFAADSENFMTEPNKVDATQLHFMIPSKYLLDAVEMFECGSFRPLPHTAGSGRCRFSPRQRMVGQEHPPQGDQSRERPRLLSGHQQLDGRFPDGPAAHPRRTPHAGGLRPEPDSEITTETVPSKSAVSVLRHHT